jgi:hypothetical protein
MLGQLEPISPCDRVVVDAGRITGLLECRRLGDAFAMAPEVGRARAVYDLAAVQEDVPIGSLVLARPLKLQSGNGFGSFTFGHALTYVIIRDALALKLVTLN